MNKEVKSAVRITLCVVSLILLFEYLGFLLFYNPRPPVPETVMFYTVLAFVWVGNIWTWIDSRKEKRKKNDLAPLPVSSHVCPDTQRVLIVGCDNPAYLQCVDHGSYSPGGPHLHHYSSEIQIYTNIPNKDITAFVKSYGDNESMEIVT